MNILYQIPGNVINGPLGSVEIDRRRQILNQWAGPGTEVSVQDAPGGPLSIETHTEEWLCVPPMIEAIRKTRHVFDAVIIGCFGDPGLAPLREILDVPVIGPFQASFHLASQLGHRVGVVTVLSSAVPLIDQLVRGMGESQNYGGTVTVEIPVLELSRRRSELVSALVKACRPLVRQGGADVLILGCMSMAFLDVATAAGRELDVPLVNPAQCALGTAEMLLAQELRQSRLTYPKYQEKLNTCLK